MVKKLFLTLVFVSTVQLAFAVNYNFENDNPSRYRRYSSEPIVDTTSNFSAPMNVSGISFFPDRENYFLFNAGVMLMPVYSPSIIGPAAHITYGHTSRYVGMEVFVLGAYAPSKSLDDYIDISVGVTLLLKLPINIDYNLRIVPIFAIGPAVGLYSMYPFLPKLYSKLGVRVDYNKYIIGVNVAMLPMVLVAYPGLTVNLEFGFKF